MDDIFNVEPPRWLQQLAQPARTDVAAKTIGNLGAAAIRYAGDRTWDSGKFDSQNPAPSFMQDVFEGRMNQDDPLWKLKESRAQLQSAMLKSQLNSQIISDQVKRKQLMDAETDAASIASLNSGDVDNPQKMLEKWIAFTPVSIDGVRQKTAAINGLRSGVAYRANQEIMTRSVDTLNKITPFVEPADAAQFSNTMQSFAQGQPDWASYQALVAKHGDKLAKIQDTAFQRNAATMEQAAAASDMLEAKAKDAEASGDMAAAQDYRRQAEVKRTAYNVDKQKSAEEFALKKEKIRNINSRIRAINSKLDEGDLRKQMGLDRAGLLKERSALQDELDTYFSDQPSAGAPAAAPAQSPVGKITFQGGKAVFTPAK